MIKKVSEYDQEIAQSQTAEKPVAPRGRATQQDTETESDTNTVEAQQSLEQLQNPTMGATIRNNRTTALERSHWA